MTSADDDLRAASPQAGAPAPQPEETPASQPAPQAPAADATTAPEPDADERAALDALASDTAREVEPPSPESLAGPAVQLDDIPDAAPRPAGDDADGTQAAPGAPGGHAAVEPADEIEAAALAHAAATAGTGQSPAQTLPFARVEQAPLPRASDSTRLSGAGRAVGALAWGARSDVGRVREHNEDSYLIDFPLFAVADGMGGHAAGEIASTIAVSSLAQCGVTKADPYALGAAVEHANQEVMEGARRGMGRQGMGTTCTAVVIEGSRMAVGHVGDSRCYLLHAGKLLRVTHDHSYVEELVEAGQITAEEARTHPKRSIITRALGSDPNMRADAFTVDVAQGDRVLLCSDGLSSMVTDSAIEEAMVSSPRPQDCAERLVDLALEAGGMDNVTVVVVDVTDDGIERHALRNRVRNVVLWLVATLAVLAAIALGLLFYANHYSWYLSDQGGYVALNRGIPGDWGPLSYSETVEVTNIQVADLSQAIEDRLEEGITFRSEDDARAVLEQYRAQIAQAHPSSQAAGTAAQPATEGAPGTSGLTGMRAASSLDAGASESARADGEASSGGAARES